MQTHKKLKAKVLSLALSVAMVATMMPATVFAAPGDNITPGTSSVGTIQSFDKLEDRFIPSVGENAPSHIYGLSVKLNTPAQDLNLPAELTAMVARTVTAPVEDETISGEDEAAKDDTAADDTVSGNQTASPSDAKEEVKKEIKGDDVSSTPESEDKETVTTTVESESIPVEWKSNKEYKSNENGKFIYTAVLPEGYSLAEGVKLPQIYVYVGRQARTGTETTVSTAKALADALEASTDGTTIKLGANITVTPSDKILFIGGNDKTVTLDLGGYTLSGTAAPQNKYIISTSGNANTNFIVQNGSIVCNNDETVALRHAGSGTMTIACTVSSTYQTIVHTGTGPMNINSGAVIETSGTIDGAVAIAMDSGTLNIEHGATVQATAAGGATAIYSSGGTVYVKGGTVTSKCPNNATRGTITANITVTLNVSGGEVSNDASPEGYSVYRTVKAVVYNKTGGTVGRVYPEDIAFKELTANGTANTTDTTELTLTFDKDLPSSAKDYVTVSNATLGTLTKESGTGIYKLTISNITVAEGGNVTVKLGEGLPGVIVTPIERNVAVHRANVCEINGTGYATLKDAVSAAQAGETIKILKDINLDDASSVLINGKTLSIELNGKTITGSCNPVIDLKNNAALTVRDSSVDKKGKLESTKANGRVICLYTGSSVTIYGGTVSVGVGCAIYNSSTGIVTIDGEDVLITSKIATASNGTIYMADRPKSPSVILNIKKGTVENTAINEGYSVYFGTSSLTSDNLSQFYTKADGATVGREKPELSSMITPTTATFDKKSGATGNADVAVTQTLNGHTLNAIKNGETTLTENTDYTVSGNTITIKKEYLAAQAVGTTTLTFDYSAGEDRTLAITVSDGSQGGSSGGGGGSSSGGGGSSGGSGGSSSGGSTITSPSSKPTEPVTGNSTTTATVDENGNATTTVTDKNISDAVKAAKDAASKKGVNAGEVTAIISVTSPANSNPNTVTVNLPKTVQEQIISDKIGNVAVVIDKPDISIGMTLATITEMNKQAKADIQLSATRTDATKLSTEAKNAIGSRPAFDLKATYASGSKSITNFGSGTVSVAIPYTLQAGEVAGGLYAVYVDGDGKVTQLTNSSYDAENKVLRFSTNHFSVYGIGYKAPVGLTDIANHWAKSDIDFVVGCGLMNGTSDTSFSPNDSMTRGMFVTVLGRLAKVDTNAYKTGTFTDLSADMYYAPYVNWAAEKGIAKGTGTNTFSPEQAISRQEMAVFMSSVAEVQGYTMKNSNEAIQFADHANIATWAAEAVKTMQMAGILNGKEGNQFDPLGTATRAEISSMLHRFVRTVVD